MTLKRGSLQAVDSTMVSTKDLRAVVDNKFLVRGSLDKSLDKREIGYIPFIRMGISSLLERER